MPPTSSKTDLMQQVAAANLNTIPAAKSSDPRAFIEAAVNWFGRWWRLRPRWDNVAPGYCALILDPDFAAAGIPAGFTEKQLFRDAPDPNLGGHIHVSDFSLNRVFRDQGGHTDADAVCRKLNSINMGAAPAVIFEPQAGVMLIAEKGVSGDIGRFPLTTFDGNLNVANFDTLCNSLYNTVLKYPETFPHIWRKKENHIPTINAEKLFQGLLYIHLKGNTQGTWIVVREDQTNAGRTDLTLTSLNPEITFVVEMKVLKSFFYHALGKPVKPFTKADNEVWAKGGVGQVCDYRTAKQANEAFLLLYDMRRKHQHMAKVSKLCAKQRVKLRKFDIFNAAARDVRAATPKPPRTR